MLSAIMINTLCKTACAFSALLFLAYAAPSQGQEIRRKETPMSVVRGRGERNISKTIRGRVFRSSATAQMRDKMKEEITIPNELDYDVSEAWVGTGNEAEDRDSNQFIVEVEGEQVYESPWMDNRDAPIRVSVPIKGRSGVTLITKRMVPSRSYESAEAVWADPVFVKFTRVSPPVPDYVPPVNTISRAPDTLTVSPVGTTYTVKVNGRPVNFGYVQPQVVRGRVFVPMRPIFEALGAFVSFNASEKEVVAVRSNNTITLRIGSQWALKNLAGIRLDAPAYSQHGTTLVPLRFVAESFNINVNFSS